MKLFVIYIGGAHEKSLIELHDMRFVVANTIEETYETLRNTWWGIPTSLHLDAWGVLNYADGYSLKISHTPPEQNDKKLYFVNLGGYDSHQFTELHQNVFVVAPDEAQAKHKAVQQITQWESPHRDYLHQIDILLDVNQLLATSNYYLHLEKETNPQPFEFTCRYTPIGKLR
ncbi:DUF1543 domain-containing protein [Legionella dresdenensis]|uniref:DUF1543 domain-containing protein n=1 Tax=Legionella dresdenensis TaxID=450200 RepID=A0ABV8CGQ0_9GAMM